MINELHISGVASFKDSPQTLSSLSIHNFFYGSNGTGKTSISRLIAEDTSYPQCHLSWNGGIKLDTFVYNKDFIDNNYSELKGVFTLGEENESIVYDIKTKRDEIDDLNSKITSNLSTLQGSDGNGGKKKELADVETKFEKKIWELKRNYDNDFKEAFSGLRNDKKAFKSRFLQESESNISELLLVDDLKSKAKTIFRDDIMEEQPIQEPNYSALIELESSSILEKVVVGSEHIDIADLIKRCGNSDWVQAGTEYLKISQDVCPFCQQYLPDRFKEKIENYFDETYRNDMHAINNIFTMHESLSHSLKLKFTALVELKSSFIDQEKLLSLIQLFEERVKNNALLIEKKMKESSHSVSLESVKIILDDISKLIIGANVKICKHNDIFKNLANEKMTLKSQIWKYLVETYRNISDDYKSETTNLNRAIHGLERSINEKRALAQVKGKEIVRLEESITSIQPTIEGINFILKSFGFTGFHLDEAENKGFYKIVREDGSEAKSSLSEGEKTFVAFLYFYHLLKGNTDKGAITSNRVVVFDDPISSLDSDILFIVSSLVKKVLTEALQRNGNVKQVFVLTHNVYFHKEVTYNSKRVHNRKLNDETFWIIRKDQQKSKVIEHDCNPIKTSYELLWNEIKDSNRSSLTVQNVIRRILEHYFKVLGNTDTDKIIDKFEGRDKLLCKSLLSWVNDGSHNTDDDLFICTGDTTVEKYLEIFRRIFKESYHISHYCMMMGIDHNSFEECEPESEALEEVEIA